MEGVITTGGPPPAPADGAASPAEQEETWVVAADGASFEEEFVAFVTVARDPLFRTAYLLCGDRHRADDLTQDTLEKTWRSWRRARRGDPLVWARRILANQRIDTWRRTRREVLADVDSGNRHTDSPTLVVDDRDAVVRALLLLPAKQRRVVVLRHLLDLSESEVADELGIPLGTVKSSAARGLARLRRTLEPSRTEEH